jgi:hypothetical protein
MVGPKVRLSLVIPGAIRLSSQECEKNPQESYNENKVFVSYTVGKKKPKLIKETITFKTRKSRTATQSISICKEAYYAMIKFPPNTSRIYKNWENLTRQARLEAHFDSIANDLHASSYSYEVLDE